MLLAQLGHRAAPRPLTPPSGVRRLEARDGRKSPVKVTAEPELLYLTQVWEGVD